MFAQKLAFAVVLAALALAFASSASAGLVSHYRFNDNAANTTVTDSVGGLHGTFNTNTNAATTTGVAGSALDMNLTNWVDLSAHTGTFGAMTDYTISMWIRDYDYGGSQMLFTVSDGTFTNRLQLQLNNGSIGSYAQGYGGSVSGVLTWLPDTWYHIVFRSTGETLEVLRNGSVVHTAPLWLEPANVTGATTVNISNLNNDIYSFSGAIDDVQIYDSALSNSEIASLFANPGTAIPEPASIALIAFGSTLLLRRRNTLKR